MPEREVDDVDVVAHPGAVDRRVVVPEHPHEGVAPGGHLHDVGHQVVGDALGVLADAAAGVGADRVEVPQGQEPPARVAGRRVDEHVLDDELRPAVGVGGAAPRGLVDRDALGVAVDRARRREDEVVHPGGRHRPQQGRRARHVDRVVPERLGHRLAHRLEPGEVDDGVDPAGQHVGECGRVVELDLVPAEAAAPGAWSASSSTRASAVGLLFEKSSMTTTSHPAASSSTAVWLPM